MKILVLNWQDRTNPYAGGAEIHLHEIFKRLVRSGHQVTLLCSRSEDMREEEVVDGVRIIRTGNRYTYPFKVCTAYRKLRRSESFDLVVEALNKVPLFSPLWVEERVHLLVHHLFGKTIFREATLPLALITWLMERPLPLAYRNTPTIAISESTAEDLARRGLSKDSVVVVHPGVDTSVEGEGVPITPPTWLYLGRVKRYKGVETLLRAGAILKQRGHSFNIKIAGEGEDIRRLMLRSIKLNVHNETWFLGRVNEPRKISLFREATANIYPSPKEGWGMTVLEAGLQGTPTIASDSPGLRDAVRDGITGILVPHGDPTALADAMESLILDASARKRLGREAKRWAKEHDWDQVATQIEQRLTRS